MKIWRKNHGPFNDSSEDSWILQNENLGEQIMDLDCEDSKILQN
jgi:hypothetical protein